jgi:ECF transporter S component (folate family)
MSKVNKLVLASLLLAILIVLERLVSIQTQFLRISFAYVPIMLGAILLGPAWSSGIAALGDVIGALFLPKGAFFPGFTLSALLTGLIHGLFLYNTKNNRQFLVRLIISTFTVLVFVHIGLTSLWLVIMYKRAFLAFASTRVIAALILLPIEVGTVFFLKQFLEPVTKRFFPPVGSQAANRAEN